MMETLFGILLKCFNIFPLFYTLKIDLKNFKDLLKRIS